MPVALLCAFDLDGTLIDSARDIHLHLNTALAAVGHPALSLAQATPLIGHGARDLVDRAMPGADAAVREEALHQLRRSYGARPVVHTVLHAGALELLGALRRGGIRTSVVTNKPHPLAVAVLEQLGVVPLLDSVHGGLPDVPLKPSPDLLRHAVEATRSERARTVMVGDSTVDLDTARALGCAFVGVAFGMDGGAGLRARSVPVHDRLMDTLPHLRVALGLPA